MNIAKRPERIIVKTYTSPTGKWKLILAEHIVAGRFCYDVLGLNTKTGAITARHYRSALEDSTNKAEAIRIFDDYRSKFELLRRKKGGATDETPPPFRIVEPS